MIELELEKRVRAQAIASLQRYIADNLPEPIGDLPAGQLLGFFVEEIGPILCNCAIADAQTRLQQRVLDLNGELFADELQYWPRLDARRAKARRAK